MFLDFALVCLGIIFTVCSFLNLSESVDKKIG